MEGGIIQSNVNSAAIAGAVAPKTAEQSDLDVKRVEAPKESSEANVEPRTREEERFAAVEEAARNFAVANHYPVSDVRFTIYKDHAVNSDDFIYVTRFTSLVDGTVTVVPEPSLFVSAGKDAGTLLDGII